VLAAAGVLLAPNLDFHAAYASTSSLNPAELLERAQSAVEQFVDIITNRR